MNHSDEPVPKVPGTVSEQSHIAAKNTIAGIPQISGVQQENLLEVGWKSGFSTQNLVDFWS